MGAMFNFQGYKNVKFMRKTMTLSLVLVCWKETCSKVKMPAVMRNLNLSMKGEEIDHAREKGLVKGKGRGIGAGAVTGVGAETVRSESVARVRREGLTETRIGIGDTRREVVETKFQSRRLTNSGHSLGYL